MVISMGSTEAAPRLGCPRRILVLGSPGAGKTIAARAIAAGLGVPIHHLDDEYWGAGWTRTVPTVWERRLRELTARDEWVLDGNYLPTVRLRAEKADLVVLVEAPLLTCLYRVLSRALAIRRGRYEHLPARVRAEAEGGEMVRATRDLGPLLWKILRFPRTDWWSVLAECVAAERPRLLVAVVPGPVRSRVPSVLRRLRRSGVAVPVGPLSEVVAAFGEPAPVRPYHSRGRRAFRGSARIERKS